MVHNPTKSLVWPFSEKVLRLFLGTALTLFIARQIGPAEFGAFSAVFAAFILFGALATLGLRDIIVDEIASGRVESGKVLSNAAVMVFVASIALALAFIAVIEVIYPGLSGELWIAIILSIAMLTKVFEIFLYGFEARADLKSVSIVQQISILGSALVKVAILAVGATVISFAAVTVLEFVLLSAAAFVFAWKYGMRISLKEYDFEYARALLTRSWPQAASAVAVVGYFYIDQIMIAMLMDTEAVGIYAAASRISQQLYILPTMLVAAYYPRLTFLNSQSQKEFETGFTSLSVVMITLSILVWIGLLLFSDPILGLLLGDDFAQTSSILKLHAIGLIFVSLNVISGRWYVMHSLQNIALTRHVLTALLNAALNMMLIPIFGYDGAIYATLFSLGFLAIGFDFFSSKTRNLFNLKVEIIWDCLRIPRIKNSFIQISEM